MRSLLKKIAFYAVLAGQISLLPTVIVAQNVRGAGNVRITNASGQTHEVKLYEGSYALVIGMSAYTNGWDNLEGVRSDVVAVRNALQKNGFAVETAENLTSDQMKTRIDDFINKYGFQSENRLLIYFAGHGHTQKSFDGRELGFVIPIDTPLPDADPLGFRQKAISMEIVQFYAKRIEAKHALFIFDSCFSGKLVSRSDIFIPPVILEDVTYPVRQFITAGAGNQPVPDDSIFRKAFVRGIEGDADRNNDSFITGSELAAYLKEKVTNLTERAQTPQYGKIRDIDLERGDFVFILKQNTPLVVAPSAPNSVLPNNNPPKLIPPNAASGEAAFWQSIENSVSEKDFAEYLKRVERGEFSGTYRAVAELKKYRIGKANAAVVWSRNRSLATSLKKYEQVRLSDGVLIAAKKSVNDANSSKFGLLNKNGEEFSNFNYDYLEDFYEGLAVVRVEKKYGYINTQGEEVISLRFDSAGAFNDDRAIVSVGGLWAAINRLGDILLKSEGLALSRYSEGLAPLLINNKYGFVDKTGKVVVQPKYDETTNDFSSGLIGVCQNGKCGYINSRGNVVIPLVYEEVTPFSENRAFVLLNGKFSLIDTTGKKITETTYSQANLFREGRALVSANGKSGFIDVNGKQVIPLIYDYASVFSDGSAMVSNKGKTGYINLVGNEVIPIAYDSAQKLRNDIYIVRLGNREIVLDSRGQEVVSGKLISLWCEALIESGLWGFYIDGEKVFVDIYGNQYRDF